MFECCIEKKNISITESVLVMANAQSDSYDVVHLPVFASCLYPPSSSTTMSSWFKHSKTKISKSMTLPQSTSHQAVVDSRPQASTVVKPTMFPYLKHFKRTKISRSHIPSWLQTRLLTMESLTVKLIYQ